MTDKPDDVAALEWAQTMIDAARHRYDALVREGHGDKLLTTGQRVFIDHMTTLVNLAALAESGKVKDVPPVVQPEGATNGKE